MMTGFNPAKNTPIRFVTAGAISNDVLLHGIDGYFDGARFWSEDGADHWYIHEVVGFRYRKDIQHSKDNP